MNNGAVLILRGHEVSLLLKAQESALIEIVERAYKAHAQGASSLPHSTFIHFPGGESNRIIALPAYLGGEFGAAGVKWISSFPGNLGLGMERASAVMVLSSAVTGRPEAIIEASIISAKRTAAGAVLAARYLHGDRQGPVGVIGAGLINFEIVKSLLSARPETRTFVVFDIDARRAAQFKNKCLDSFEQVEVCVEKDFNAVLKKCPLISFATTASEPYVSDLSACLPDATILHVSLRDLSPEVILANDNVADDIGHVCRAGTSLHLTEQLVGHREFIRCTLADILQGVAPARRKAGGRVIFSPFGLGVLDLAVGKHVYELALRRGIGTSIEEFMPASWVERD